MKFQQLLMLALAIALALPRPSLAEIFKWIDSRGNIHYTQNLDEVPVAQRAAARSGAKARPKIIGMDPGRVMKTRDAQNVEEVAPAKIRYSPRVAGSDSDTVNGWDEDRWRLMHGALQQKIAQLEQQIQVLEEQGADNKPPARRRQNVTRRRFERYHERHQRYRKATRDVVTARRDLEAFRDKAHRAGVPPGWLR